MLENFLEGLKHTKLEII